MSIYEKLSNIQIALKVPKSQENTFGKYNYRNCEDILEAVKPLCREQNTTLTISDCIAFIEGRHYVEATATLTDWTGGAAIAVKALAREEESKKGMDGSQVTGASSSYARKYALNGLFNIDDTKDSDTTNTGDTQKKEVKPEPVQKTAAANKPMTLEEAKTYMTKGGTLFDKLSDDYLQKIIDSNAKEESKEAARLILAARDKDMDDLTPLDDGDLPF